MTKLEGYMNEFGEGSIPIFEFHEFRRTPAFPLSTLAYAFKSHITFKEGRQCNLQ